MKRLCLSARCTFLIPTHLVLFRLLCTRNLNHIFSSLFRQKVWQNHFSRLWMLVSSLSHNLCGVFIFSFLFFCGWMRVKCELKNNVIISVFHDNCFVFFLVLSIFKLMECRHKIKIFFCFWKFELWNKSFFFSLLIKKFVAIFY